MNSWEQLICSKVFDTWESSIHLRYNIKTCSLLFIMYNYNIIQIFSLLFLSSVYIIKTYSPLYHLYFVNLFTAIGHLSYIIYVKYMHNNNNKETCFFLANNTYKTHYKWMTIQHYFEDKNGHKVIPK